MQARPLSLLETLTQRSGALYINGYFEQEESKKPGSESDQAELLSKTEKEMTPLEKQQLAIRKLLKDIEADAEKQFKKLALKKSFKKANVIDTSGKTASSMAQQTEPSSTTTEGKDLDQGSSDAQNHPLFKQFSDNMSTAISAYVAYQAISNAPEYAGQKATAAKALNQANTELRSTLSTVDAVFGGMSKTTLIAGILLAGLTTALIATQTDLFSQVVGKLAEAGLGGSEKADIFAKVLAGAAVAAPFVVPAAWLAAKRGFEPTFYAKTNGALMSTLTAHQSSKEKAGEWISSMRPRRNSDSL